MPKQYDPPGLRHYVEAEAEAMDLQDGPDNHHPVALASQLEPLQAIANSVTIACNNRRDAATVTDALSHAEDQLDAILLGYRASVVMLAETCDGLEVPIPRWLKQHAATAEPESKMTAIREVSEKVRAADLERELLAAGIAPGSTEARGWVQNENPHPQPDPSPTQLLDPTRDGRNYPRPPGHEVTPDPNRTEPDHETLPSPRQTADQTPAQAADLQAGRKPRPRDRRPAPVDPVAPSPTVPPTPVHGDPAPGDSSTVTPQEGTADAPQPASPGEQGREPLGDPPADNANAPGPDQPSG